jgi:hypothetical protein
VLETAAVLVDSEDCIAAPVCLACAIPFAVRGGSYGVGEERCHSRSNWSSRAPCLRKKIVDGGGEDIFCALRVSLTGCVVDKYGAKWEKPIGKHVLNLGDSANRICGQ